jgi:hypothetical protein
VTPARPDRRRFLKDAAAAAGLVFGSHLIFEGTLDKFPARQLLGLT